jgi:hypothetical protein
VQHYGVVEFFPDSEEKYQERLRNDALKRELCVEEWIALIEIPYTLSKDNGVLEAFITRELTQLGVM